MFDYKAEPRRKKSIRYSYRAILGFPQSVIFLGELSDHHLPEALQAHCPFFFFLFTILFIREDMHTWGKEQRERDKPTPH